MIRIYATIHFIGPKLSLNFTKIDANKETKFLDIFLENPPAELEIPPFRSGILPDNERKMLIEFLENK